MSVLDQPVPTRVGVAYVHVSYHRNRNPEKSQWTITMAIEVEIFSTAFESATGTPLPTSLWGLWRFDGETQVVGLSRAAHPPQYDLKISRFEKNQSPEYWHGYPADYLAHARDRPPISTLRIWRDAGIITKADAARIRGGKPCDL